MRTTVGTRVLRLSLAAWLLVAATSSCLCHAHEGGDEAHSHDLGVFAFAPAADIAPPPGGSVAPICTPHWHLIVLGFELQAPGSTGSADGPAFATGLMSVPIGDPDGGTDDAAIPATPTPDLAPPAPALISIAPPPTLQQPSPCLAADCPCARGERSGVLVV
jgi:hypothetical protein